MSIAHGEKNVKERRIGMQQIGLALLWLIVGLATLFVVCLAVILIVSTIQVIVKMFKKRDNDRR